MNLKLKRFLTQKVESLLEGPNKNVILDLFGGNGNLTRQFKSNVIVIDNCQLKSTLFLPTRLFTKETFTKKIF